MHIPLVIDQSDYRWRLLKEILNIFDLRKVKRIIARYARLRAIPILKIVTTSMFFSTQISHVLDELRYKEELRNFLRIKEDEVPKGSYWIKLDKTQS